MRPHVLDCGQQCAIRVKAHSVAQCAALVHYLEAWVTLFKIPILPPHVPPLLSNAKGPCLQPSPCHSLNRDPSTASSCRFIPSGHPSSVLEPLTAPHCPNCVIPNSTRVAAMQPGRDSESNAEEAVVLRSAREHNYLGSVAKAMLMSTATALIWTNSSIVTLFKFLYRCVTCLGLHAGHTSESRKINSQQQIQTTSFTTCILRTTRQHL